MDAHTRFVIASTDPVWLSFLRARNPREVNFWRPSATPMHTERGTPWFYRARGTQDIVGCAFFVAYSRMPISMAWQTFGEANGVPTFEALLSRIAALRNEPTTPISEVGCAALVDPVYFEKPVRFGRMYGPLASGDTRTAEGARLWDELREATIHAVVRAAGSPLVLRAGRGAPTLVSPRLGQGAFRTAVLAAYDQKCAITGERTLPVLQAAHIRPFAKSEEHDVRNGLLLRSDLHALFDAGLVTVDAQHRFHVSSQIRQRYENGRDYYAMQGRDIRLPSDERDRPLTEYLDFHRTQIFQP